MVSMSNIILNEMIKQDPLQTLCNTFETGQFSVLGTINICWSFKNANPVQNHQPQHSRMLQFWPSLPLKALVNRCHNGGAFKLVLKKLNVVCSVLHAVTVFELANVEYRCKKLKRVCTQEHRKWEVSSVANRSVKMNILSEKI